jgi:hypothetical protein
MAARKKLDAKGLLSKTKLILGLLWNFRNLTISLPKNKLIAWTDGIKNLIAKKKVYEKELETTIGRLTHMSMIIPPSTISSADYANYYTESKTTTAACRTSPQFASTTST